MSLTRCGHRARALSRMGGAVPFRREQSGTCCAPGVGERRVDLARDQIVDQSHGADPSGKLFLASWLESELWVDPWMIGIGLVGLLAAIFCSSSVDELLLKGHSRTLGQPRLVTLVLGRTVHLSPQRCRRPRARSAAASARCRGQLASSDAAARQARSMVSRPVWARAAARVAFRGFRPGIRSNAGDA